MANNRLNKVRQKYTAQKTRIDPATGGRNAKGTLLAAIFTLALGAFSDFALALEGLAELQWENRVVLLDARENAGHFEAELTAADFDIVDRDILWFILDESGITTNYAGVVSPEFTSKIRDDYFADGSRVVLVGKDGGVKYRHNTLELSDIFDRIDAMPMRQQEMLDNAN